MQEILTSLFHVFMIGLMISYILVFNAICEMTTDDDNPKVLIVKKIGFVFGFAFIGTYIYLTQS